MVCHVLYFSRGKEFLNQGGWGMVDVGAGRYFPASWKCGSKLRSHSHRHYLSLSAPLSAAMEPNPDVTIHQPQHLKEPFESLPGPAYSPLVSPSLAAAAACAHHIKQSNARALSAAGDAELMFTNYASSGPSNGIVVSLVLFTLDRISPALRLSGAPGETLRCAPCRVKSCFAVCAPPLDEHGVSGR
jgi:hypothetical protein